MSSILSLVDLLESSVAKYGERPLLGSRRGGRWIYTTYAEFQALVDALCTGLASVAVGRGDKVGIIANNRLEWAVVAYATYGSGAALVPMYESQLEKDWEFIVRDSEIKVLFVANAAIYEKTKALLTSLPTLSRIVLIE